MLIEATSGSVSLWEECQYWRHTSIAKAWILFYLHLDHVSVDVLPIRITSLPWKFICHCFLLPSTDHLDIILRRTLSISITGLHKECVTRLWVVCHDEGVLEVVGGSRLTWGWYLERWFGTKEWTSKFTGSLDCCSGARVNKVVRDQSDNFHRARIRKLESVLF